MIRSGFGQFLRFAAWRRDSGGWVYVSLVGSWSVLTLVTADATGWGWRFVVGSAAVFVLIFEVGLAYVIAAAWGSHRQLEREGEIQDLIKRLELEKLGREEREAVIVRLVELGQPVEVVDEP
jgi:hypothetical protein